MRMQQFSYIALFLLAIGSQYTISGLERNYNMTMGKKGEFIKANCTLNEVSNTLTIQCKSKLNEETLIYKNSQLTTWSNNYADGNNFNAKLTNNMIHVSGNIKEKQLNKQFDTTIPWIQSPAFGLTPFVKSTSKKIKFFMVTGPRLTTLVAKKEKDEVIIIDNTQYETTYIKINPPGLFSKLWKAEAWFDKKTGYFVKYSSPVGPPGSKKLILTYINPN